MKCDASLLTSGNVMVIKLSVKLRFKPKLGLYLK